jgi:hypothetical protein
VGIDRESLDVDDDLLAQIAQSLRDLLVAQAMVDEEDKLRLRRGF